MRKQIPIGPSDVYCPQWRKPMSKVCHTCAWYVEGMTKDPTTGKITGVLWECAMTANVKLSGAIAQNVREAAGETNALRGDLITASGNTQAAAEAYQMIAARREPMKLIEGN